LKKAKYQWAIDRSPPRLDGHSRVKHEVLTGYVDRYIRTLLNDWRFEQLRLTIVDGFCGGGEYVDCDGQRVDGSPLRVLEQCETTAASIRAVREKQVDIDIEYVFIDQDARAIGHLNGLLDHRGYRACSGQGFLDSWTSINAPQAASFSTRFSGRA
jgi:three-Cys-motif partner protein